jgi:Ankyrin repeat
VRIWSRNRYSGFSITELIPIAGIPNGCTALDYVIRTYPRDPNRLIACIELLLAAGGHTSYDIPGVLPILRGRVGELAAVLDVNPSLIHRRYRELAGVGQSGGRLLTLRGATLLHVAAEYGFVDATRLLLDRGADVNAVPMWTKAGSAAKLQSFTL